MERVRARLTSPPPPAVTRAARRVSAIDWSTDATALRAALDAGDAESAECIVGEGVYARLAAQGAHYDAARAAVASLVSADESAFAAAFAAWHPDITAATTALDRATRYAEQVAIDARAGVAARRLARTGDGVEVILAPDVSVELPPLASASFDDCLALSEGFDATPAPAGRVLLSGASAQVLSLRAKRPGQFGAFVRVAVPSVAAGRATITLAYGDYVETITDVVTSGERVHLGAWDASRLVAPPLLVAPGDLATQAPLGLATPIGGWFPDLLDRADLALGLPEVVGPARAALALARRRFADVLARRPAWSSRLAELEATVGAAIDEARAATAMLAWTP